MTTVGNSVGKGMSTYPKSVKHTHSSQFMYRSNGEPQKDPGGPGGISEAFHTDSFCRYFPSHLWEHCCFSMSKGSENSNDLIPTIIFTLTKGQTSLKTVTGRICSVLFKRADTLQIGVSLMWLEPSELELYTVGH